MLVLGPILLIALAVYESKVAHYPFIPGRFLKNPTVLAAALIGLFDFISFYLQFTYQYSFICSSYLYLELLPVYSDRFYLLPASCRERMVSGRPKLFRTNSDNFACACISSNKAFFLEKEKVTDFVARHRPSLQLLLVRLLSTRADTSGFFWEVFWSAFLELVL